MVQYKIRSDKSVRLAEDIGPDIADLGVSTFAENGKRFLLTKQNEGRNSSTQRRNSDKGLLLNKTPAATAESTNLMAGNMKDINVDKRKYSVSNSVNCRSSYKVKICSSPTCSCPDFQKNDSRVSGKQVLFLLRYVLQIYESDELLKNRYFSEDCVKAWFCNNTISSIDQQYVQRVEKSCRSNHNLEEIISSYPL